jgi:hypothetical protein
MKRLPLRAIFPLTLLAFVVTQPQSVAAQEPQSAAPAAADAAPAQNQTNVPNAAAIIRKIHEAQYSLPKQGMKSFRCSITIDWDSLYKDLGANSESAQTLIALLKKTRFKVVVGPDGSSSLSRESDEPPPSQEIADRLQQSQAGAEQMINGFLKSWAGFMVNSMIPAPDEKYHLVLADGKYLLTFSESGTDMAIDLGQDFAMQRVSVKSSAVSAEFKPTFERTPDGFVLTGYSGTFPAPAAGGPTSAEAQIENELVDGLELPRHLNFSVPIKDITLIVPMTFSDYQVTKKTADPK